MIVLVDVEGHLDHAPSGLLRRFVVQLRHQAVVFGNVAIVAIDTQRRGHETHYRDQLRIRQPVEHFNVLARLLDGFLLLAGSGAFGAAAIDEHDNYAQRNKGDDKKIENHSFHDFVSLVLFHLDFRS